MVWHTLRTVNFGYHRSAAITHYFEKPGPGGSTTLARVHA